MIIYGIKATEIAAEPIVEPCPHCGTRDSLKMHILQRYAHIFWVPVFPIGQTGASQCNQCHQVLKLKEMSEALRLNYANLKARSSMPLWTFAGLGIIGALVLMVVFSGN